MVNKRKIGLLSIGMVGLFITLVIIISYFLQIPEQTIPEVASLTKETLTINDTSLNNGFTLVGTKTSIGGHQSNDFKQNGSFYYEATAQTLNKMDIPSINGVQLYCIEKGNPIEYNASAVSFVRGLQGTGASGTCKASNCRWPNPSSYISNTYYLCVNNHTEIEGYEKYIVTSPSNFVAPYDGTYYVGDSLMSEFSKGENISEEVRQVAIWLSSLNEGDDFEPKSKFTYLDMAKSLKQEAEDYKDYETDLENNINEPIKETTMKTVQINVNQKEQYLIIGPYKMDYVDGRVNGVTFAGISNMVVKGYNDKERQVFIKDIEIIQYNQNGEYYNLDFFEPNEEDGYVDRAENSYPESGQEFYIKIKNPNQGETDSDKVVRYIDIRAEYSYMTAYAMQCELEGHHLEATAVGSHRHYRNNKKSSKKCRYNYVWQVEDIIDEEQKMLDCWGERKLYKIDVDLTGKPKGSADANLPLDITMNLGGYVWEDVKGDKATVADGIYSNIYNAEKIDKALPNVKVTLYEWQTDKNGNLKYENGKPAVKVADLLSTADRKELTQEEKLNRVNPKQTDENGYYQFEGLNSSNKYYVTFEYNGQVYLPTEYLVIDKDKEGNLEHANSINDIVFNAGLYNTDIWEATSKGAELESERSDYNEQFEEIGSSPKNYISSNSLESGKLIRDGKSYYNETFSINDLMGFKLNEDGEYVKSEIQLIDGFYKIDDGYIVETDTIQQGIISKKIEQYIEKYYEYPQGNDLIDLYADIVDEYAANNKEKEELWKKLQYIEDCKIKAYTCSPFENGEVDLYPVYDDFTIDDEKMVIPGEGTKPPIYDGQYYINLGLWERAQNNLALIKDVYRAATKINGKTEVYTYDKRGENEDYWEIQLRMKDYYNYYGTYYNRELYSSDYYYKAANTNLYGEELELYVTYKIEIRNSSQNILNEVTEVVDYYDKDYTYMEDLSWVMYKDSNTETGYDKIAVTEDGYRNMIHNLDLSEIAYARDVKSSYGTKANNNKTYTGNSIYGKDTQQDIEEELNSIYICGLDEKKLATGESAYIYLTFKVNSDAEGPVILDDDNSLKENYVEINGYKNYYVDGTKLPNNVTIKGNNTPAGIIDYNSTPGNLELEDLQGEKYEKNFEDDTDRAKSIKVLIDEEAIRNLNGTVWEDERTQTVSDSIIGDGVRQEDEIGVQGVTVELVEKLENGKEYVWQTTTTDNSGKYEFAEFIPGNYIVRFQYGNTSNTVKTEPNGGQNAVSYNGQDFKSTVYQQDLENGKEIGNYTDEYYNIQDSDRFSVNVSDAKDLWSNRTAETGRTNSSETIYKGETYQGRTEVNEYSEQVTNYKAEVLASPYSSNQNESLLRELINKTHMNAETGIIVAEIEYNRTTTDGYKTESNGANIYLYGNDYNSNYTFNNVDLGLTERPKAQLELNKKVTNVKITLANGNILFDDTQSVDNLIWLSGNEYNLSSKMNNNKYEEYYDKSKEDSTYNRYSYRTEIDNLLKLTYISGTNGLITATIDEELMHGATIQISYKLTVKNVGETDYTGKDFYYKATGISDANKVTTAANLVIDYVANNLQYRDTNNEGWEVKKVTDIVKEDNTTLVNNSLKNQVSGFNVILQTSSLDTILQPGDTVEKDLHLTQLITSENDDDDKTYKNIAEIVQISNTVGRRMAYSIVGNQDPTVVPSEVDSSKAEEVMILPPFGIQYLYYGLAIIAIGLLVTGIILIKKKMKF